MNAARALLLLVTIAGPCAIPSAAHAQAAASEAGDAGYGTHPDEGLMIAGAVTFAASYVIAISIALPEITRYCGTPAVAYDCNAIGYQLIPFAHFVPFEGLAMYSGPIWVAAELVGLFMLIGGAAHHHPNAPPSLAFGPAVELRPSAPGADVGGLSLTASF